MKNLIYLLFAVFLFSAIKTTAQNIKPYPMKMSYRQLPVELLPGNYQYYSTSIAIDPAFGRQMSITETELKGMIKIGGFKKINKGGNFFVEVIFDQPLNDPNRVSMKTRENKSKKEDGTQVVTKYHWWQHDLVLPIALRVTDMNNEVLIDQIIRSANEVTAIKGKETQVYADALKGRKSSGSTIYAAYKNAIKGGMTAANNIINKKYGFPIVKLNPDLGILAAKKHPNYAKWQTEMETAKTAYAKLSGDKSMVEFKTDIAPVMSFWEGEYNANDKDNKKQKKLWYQSAANLMMTNFWLEDYDSAKKYASEIAGQKVKKSSGEAMLKRIDKVQASMAAINAETRYFPIEIADPTDDILNIAYEGERQSKIDAYKERAMGINEETQEYIGTITTTQGKDFPVTFVIDYSRALWLDFEASGNVKFFREGESSVKREYLDVTKIKGFKFDNRTFRLMEYKPASAVKISLKKTVPAQYLEIIYEAEKIGVYHFYPNRQSNNQLGEQVDELVLRKGPAGADLISMGGLKYLSLKKGLSTLFEECESLVASIQAGNFKRSDESLKQLAIQYENDCLK